MTVLEVKVYTYSVQENCPKIGRGGRTCMYCKIGRGGRGLLTGGEGGGAYMYSQVVQCKSVANVIWFNASFQMARSAAAGSADKKKEPSRKQRRKGRSLREEQRRRERDHVWLETHVWHAKRFKMVDRYGYRLAESASDKGVRAAYRSLMHGCLLSVSDCD